MADSKRADAVASYNIESFTLLSVALLVVALRTHYRINIVGIRHFEADDYLVLVGAVFHALETGAAYYAAVRAHGLANNSMTDEQRATLDPNSEEYQLRVLGSKIQIIGYSLYSVLMWSLKAAMCNFYLRLTHALWKYRRRILFGFVFIGLSWAVVVLNLLLPCRPLKHMWQINPNPGIYCQPALSPTVLGTTFAFNVATDLYLMSIPIPIIFEVHMKTSVRIGLSFLFCCAFLIIIAASLRVGLILENPIEGALLSASWAVRETFIAVIVTNLPVLYPLLKHWLGLIATNFGTDWLGYDKQQSADTKSSREAHRASGGTTSTVGARKKRWRPSTYPTISTMNDGGQEENAAASQVLEMSYV